MQETRPALTREERSPRRKLVSIMAQEGPREKAESGGKARLASMPVGSRPTYSRSGEFAGMGAACRAPDEEKLREFVSVTQWGFKAAWASSITRVSLARQAGSGTCGKAADAER